MTFEQLRQDMYAAMKNGDRVRKQVISGLIESVQKMAIDKKCRDNITETMVDETILKCQKSIQEMIDTCPVDRVETLENYNAQLAIVKEYAPQLISDETEILNMIIEILNEKSITATKENKGLIMKTVMPVLKGKADMKVANQVLNQRLFQI